jgi:uncharacterized membrane protein
MNQNIISSVFDSQSEAESAVQALRAAGLSDTALSIIGQQDGRTTTSDGGGNVDDGGDTGDAVKGALGGAGVGALLGIAALAIPGVGPLVAAGAIASSAIPGAAAIGAGVGAMTGGLTGLLSSHGVSDEDASYYEGRINDGGVFVSVDTSQANLTAEEAQRILREHGGHSASQPRMETSQQF